MSSDVTINELRTSSSEIDGLVVIDARTVTEARGTVRELYRESVYPPLLALAGDGWKQINLTRTKSGTVRGLHGEAMAKLVMIASGSALGVYLDARPDSSTVGNVVTVELIPGRQVFVPRGVCNGFQVTSAEDAEYLYFFDTEWQPGMTGVAVTPLDPAVAHLWPIPIDPDNREQISEKDVRAPLLSTVLGD